MSNGKKEFREDLVSFYVTFFKALADSVIILSNIQKKYKPEYKSLREIQGDPTKIYELMEKMSDEDKRILIDLILRANILQSKLIRVFELSSKQQIEYAKEIKNYTKDFINFARDKNV